MLFLLLFFLFKPGEYSFTGIYFFRQNPLNYHGAVIRENEFEIFNPLYFYLKELQFFKIENQRITPYQMKFEWDMGLKKENKNSVLRLIYNHVCNHGIDHPGIDRRQWNQFAVKIDLWNRYFYLRNSTGYVVSPFGPKRKNNNYNWIFLHNLIFKKDFGYFRILFDIEFEGFLDVSSLKYSSTFKIIIANERFLMGSGLERRHGLQGVNTEALSLYEIFTGIMERIPEFEVSYGYLFKNPDYSFFSDFMVKYKIFKTTGILTHLKTVSPPKTQQPRFYDYKIGLNMDFKNINLQLYHRERRDGNLFDGKFEEINAFNLNKRFLMNDYSLKISFDYIFKKSDYPFYLQTQFNIKREIYGSKNSLFGADFEIDSYYLYGNRKTGFILSAGPSFIINSKKEIKLCFRQKISSSETLEYYGILEQRFFISIRFKNKEKCNT